MSSTQLVVLAVLLWFWTGFCLTLPAFDVLSGREKLKIILVSVVVFIPRVRDWAIR